MWINLHVEFPDSECLRDDYLDALRKLLGDPGFQQGTHRCGDKVYMPLHTGGTAAITIEYEPVHVRDARWREERLTHRVKESER